MEALLEDSSEGSGGDVKLEKGERKLMPKEITYLASIYSSPFSHLKEIRYKLACAACAFFKQETDFGVYSPVVHWHPISIRYEIPGDFHTWQEEDKKMITLLDSFTVLRSEGWEKSEGVRTELLFAQKLRKKINWLRLLEPVPYPLELRYKFKFLD